MRYKILDFLRLPIGASHECTLPWVEAQASNFGQFRGEQRIRSTWMCVLSLGERRMTTCNSINKASGAAR